MTDKAKFQMTTYLKSIGFTTEYEFAKSVGRRFRADFCHIEHKIIIEYEGLVSHGARGGHQTKKGYTDNCEKYNLAARLGYVVLRYTAINYQHDPKRKYNGFVADVDDMIKIKTNIQRSSK